MYRGTVYSARMDHVRKGYIRIGGLRTCRVTGAGLERGVDEGGVYLDRITLGSKLGSGAHWIFMWTLPGATRLRKRA